jgi:RimJ/RimL family protein N-acetyltransferase
VENSDFEVSVERAQIPAPITISGRYVNLAPLSAKAHGESLWEGTRGAANDSLWAYLFDGPFANRDDFDASLRAMEASRDPLYFAIIDGNSKRAVGRAAYLRIDGGNRSIEVGSILYTPPLQRTRGATEAMYLMARHAFEELGYRRYEWKCNVLNEPSRRAALRLGFTFEGIFRQHMIVKGRNRDTAWYAMLDSEWPERKAAFEGWLDPGNFWPDGRQKRALSEMNEEKRRSGG